MFESAFLMILFLACYICFASRALLPQAHFFILLGILSYTIDHHIVGSLSARLDTETNQ